MPNPNLTAHQLLKLLQRNLDNAREDLSHAVGEELVAEIQLTGGGTRLPVAIRDAHTRVAEAEALLLAGQGKVTFEDLPEQARPTLTRKA